MIIYRAIVILSYFQKRKTLRASIAAQRRIKSNGVNDSTTTISLAVDRSPGVLGLRPCPPRSILDKGWATDTDLRQRRLEELGIQPAPRYMPAYTTDVSHLVV